MFKIEIVKKSATHFMVIFMFYNSSFDLTTVHTRRDEIWSRSLVIITWLLWSSKKSKEMVWSIPTRQLLSPLLCCTVYDIELIFIHIFWNNKSIFRFPYTALANSSGGADWPRGSDVTQTSLSFGHFPDTHISTAYLVKYFGLFIIKTSEQRAAVSFLRAWLGWNSNNLG